MEILFGFALCVAACVAAAHAIEKARVALVADYRKRASAWTAAHPNSMKAARLAGVMATAVHGARPAWRVFKADWLEHWRAARDEVRAKYDRLPPMPVQESGPVEMAEPVEIPGPAPKPEPSAQTAPIEYPPLRVVPGGNQPKRGAPMATATVTEANTVGAIRSILQGVVERATAELEDAQAEHARAQAEMRVVTNLAENAPTVFDRDPATAAMCASLVEPIQQRINSATTRVSAADSTLGQARLALDGVAKHTFMEEAVNATPQASTNSDVYAGQ
jgi:hypothetical protein